MDTEDDKVGNVLDLIAKFFPENAEKISTIGFVNWHNIVNHSSLEELDAKEVLFVANLILALASVNYESTTDNTLTVSNNLKQVSFDEALDFLNEGIDKDEKDL